MAAQKALIRLLKAFQGIAMTPAAATTPASNLASSHPSSPSHNTTNNSIAPSPVPSDMQIVVPSSDHLTDEWFAILATIPHFRVAVAKHSKLLLDALRVETDGPSLVAYMTFLQSQLINRWPLYVVRDIAIVVRYIDRLGCCRYAH